MVVQETAKLTARGWIRKPRWEKNVPLKAYEDTDDRVEELYIHQKFPLVLAIKSHTVLSPEGDHGIVSPRVHYIGPVGDGYIPIPVESAIYWGPAENITTKIGAIIQVKRVIAREFDPSAEYIRTVGGG